MQTCTGRQADTYTQAQTGKKITLAQDAHRHTVRDRQTHRRTHRTHTHTETYSEGQADTYTHTDIQ